MSSNHHSPKKGKAARFAMNVLAVGGVVYCTTVGLAAFAYLYADTRFPGFPISREAFIFGSLAAAVCAALFPWVLGKPPAWTAIAVAIILQFDVGGAYRVDFSAGSSTVPKAHSQGSHASICVQPQGEIPDVNDPFTRLEHETAVAEIRTRVDQEQSLFYLKFGVVAAVLLALYSMLSDSGRRIAGTQSMGIEDALWNVRDSISQSRNVVPQRESSNQQAGTAERRWRNTQKIFEHRFWLFTNAYFWIAVLASAVIDTRLRFNSKMMETLGCWIKILESHSDRLFWETYLRKKDVFFEPPTYAILRAFPCLLTILLFSGTVYFTLIQQRMYPRGIARACACGTLVVFCCMASSYHGESWYWVIHCISWTAIGIFQLLQDSRVFASSPILRLFKRKPSV